MLRLLLNGRDAAEIVDQLAVESGARPEVIAQDARDFFEELKSLGVIEECSVSVASSDSQA
ncbi:hypothetical protein GCM10011507_34480 [Edaphobacter acidisoli]|uniref:PqqD family protein n=2 Tax=Edaphobacter acidisoli TaxID=2040573 RepID=A0A916S2B6_9BACT|nr:hypothetical protein GCM10011507_34480 [Edaphobacter acidisoli]